MIKALILTLLIPVSVSADTYDMHGDIGYADGAPFVYGVGQGGFVNFDSRGGRVLTAMDMGKHMKIAGAIGIVDYDAECSSACIFALMGARKILVGNGAAFGIHRPTNPSPGVRNMLAKYALTMGVSRSIIDKMWEVPNSDIRWLGAQEISLYFPQMEVVN